MLRSTSFWTFALAYACGACSSDSVPYDTPSTQTSSDSTTGSQGSTSGSGGAATTGGMTATATSTATSTASSTASSTTTTDGGSTDTTSSTTSGTPIGGTVTSTMSTTGGSTTTSGTMGGTTGGQTTGGGMGGSMGAGGSGGGGSQGSTTGGVLAEPDCNAQMPSGGTQHSGNGRGGQGNLAWEIWSNTQQGELTTFDGMTSFRASWNEAGGYLGRMGFEWGNNGAPYTAHGTIAAQFVSNKTGDGGLYSYVGMYGWTTDPCVEWYVIDDSFKQMPVNPGNTVQKNDIQVDGGTYVVYTRDTTGTGGSRCSGVNSWIQYYSIRRTARTCGIITLSDHFKAWDDMGMSMAGNLLEAKIIAEVGGAVGSVDFPIANVTTSQ